MVMRHVPVVANPVGYRAGGHLIAEDLSPAPHGELAVDGAEGGGGGGLDDGVDDLELAVLVRPLDLVGGADGGVVAGLVDDALGDLAGAVGAL